MIVQEIITTIKVKYPPAAAYADSYFLMMLTDIQNRIFRTLYKPETTDTYDLLAGNPFYPVEYSPETITDIVVNGTEYPIQNTKYDAQSYFYYIEQDNTIGIYPTPTEDVSGGLTVFHYREPNELSSVSDTPELDRAWHMMLVYNACREFAVMARDDMVNTFISEINDLEKQFKQSRQARPHKIQDVYGVGRGAS